ncbi:MAG: diguanylate cyclase [Pseudomonadota bacterium]
MIEKLEDHKFLTRILNGINCGIVVIDKDINIHSWNGFMVSHSGLSEEQALGHCLFDLFEKIPRRWLTNKVQSVFMLKNFAFTSWEQRPYLFPFYHNRPATSIVDHMYQDCTFIPLFNQENNVEYVCITIQDVTDTAIYQILLQQTKEEIERQSKTDGLTQLYNRSHWEECLRREVSRVERYEGELTIIMMDLDHFKSINDRLGHLAGDEVIRESTRILRDCLRNSDIGGRYGGEEFGVILPETDIDGALVTAERIRQAIETSDIVFNNKAIKVTASLGIAMYDVAGISCDQLIDRADQALYQAKHAGRNCIRAFE